MTEEPADKSSKGLGGLSPALQWVLLVAISAGIAASLIWLRAPAPLMLGPLIAGIIVASNGGKPRMPLSAFVFAQGVVGCMIARMVPLSIVGDILAHWQLFTVGVLAVVGASILLGWLMTRLQMLPGTTALWGISPGAASVMTIMSESYGADVRLVAFMQYLRVVMVAGVAALVAKMFGVTAPHGGDAIAWFPDANWLSFGETLVVAVVGPLIARVLKIPAGAMLVPLVICIVLAHVGLMTVELPPWALAVSFAFIGWNIGLRFTRPLLLYVARMLPRAIACAAVLIALCGVVAWLMVVTIGVDPLTAYLATSPGGVDSIAIIAASTNCDVSFVMAMQTVRLLAVLFLAPVLTKFIAERVSYSDDRHP
ncbi:MAG: AbrB family transcriptional regulator [Proteobacteria bacterium]|nr:AbrB family transcriptional regulator [Pseudomonadota bacterium]